MLGIEAGSSRRAATKSLGLQAELLCVGGPAFDPSRTVDTGLSAVWCSVVWGHLKGDSRTLPSASLTQIKPLSTFSVVSSELDVPISEYLALALAITSSFSLFLSSLLFVF